MESKYIKQYDAPHQFEPLMPREALMSPLLERASDLSRVAAKLGSVASTSAHRELRTLLRSMNSYYTNRIEGEHTRPADIERALANDFSSNSDISRKQRLAVAHIQTEKVCEEIVESGHLVANGFGSSLYSMDALRSIHKQLFAEITDRDLTLADGTMMKPGEIRKQQVAIGRHEAPNFQAVPLFIDRWAQFYGGIRRGEASIVAAAASHHRLTWIHPFEDGNGRLSRLHTHLLMHSMGLSTGLWSPLRGFARSETRYRELLTGADEHRRGDLDGRGNLSEAGLVEWINYTIDMCIDQVEFMSKQIDSRGMRDRIAACLIFEEDVLKSGVRKEALTALHYLFTSQGELARAEFKTMTGLGERVATEALSALLRKGYLATDSAYGRVRFAVPMRALRFYFPSLWPEVEKDEEFGPGSSGSPARYPEPAEQSPEAKVARRRRP